MNPDTPATAFQRARELREDGKSLRAIADILAAESVPLPPGRTTKWSHTAVVRLFRQFDTPPAAPGRAGRPEPPASPAPPPPPPPVRLDRDMPPLVGPGWGARGMAASAAHGAARCGPAWRERGGPSIRPRSCGPGRPRGPR